MFGCSAAYHLVPAPSWKSLLRRLDQAAIFLKIAGTYTPFALDKIGGVWGYSVFGAVWVAALAGATAKLLLTSNWDHVSVVLYVALGWAGIFILQPLSGAISATTLLLLAGGGVLYTLGVVFHLWNSLPYQNAIWHLFVLAGTACHFAAVVTAVFE
jgi:hemolysin III